MKSFFKNIVTFVKAHPGVDALLFVVGLAIFATITLLNVNNASIWFDEAFSAYIIQFNYLEIAQFTATDVHPPFYYWVLKTWSLLFGTTELALRSMSIFFGAVAIGGIFIGIRRYFGRAIAAVTLLLLVLSPTLIRYSDEARMYTVATIIVLAATWMLVKATATNKKRWWVIYGLLVALGMWTHYFTVVAWFSHWVWRALTAKRGSAKQWMTEFLSFNWILAHIVAVVAYLPWLPSFYSQTKIVQSGFWIGPVSIDTPVNYLSNLFYYLEHGQVQGWWVVLLLAIVAITIALVPKAYKALATKERRIYLLLAVMAWVAPIILIVMSLPPFYRPVFVERYLVPASIIASIFFAVTYVVATKKWRVWLRVVPVILVVVAFSFGITNVYKYGNFNKNSNTNILTRQVVEQIREKAPDGTPIIASTPWVFYEAVFYDTPEHPVYFIDEATKYEFGSLDMLKLRDDHKIKDLEAFKKEHPVIWYIGNAETADVLPYQTSWQRLQTVESYDSITGKTQYRATEYRVSAE